MHEAPTGTVTLIFTDIQGSTMLWDTIGDEFLLALELHNLLVRQCLHQHNGYEVKTEGDAFMVAFVSASAATRFCLDVQLSLQNADWPAFLLEQSQVKAICGPSECGGFVGLRVRMGVHTGQPRCETDVLTGRMDYFGSDVNRTARVAALAQGGQILISNSAWKGMGGAPHDCLVEDLGVHGLSGLREPEHLRSLLPTRLNRRRFSVLGASREKRTNLHPGSDSFVGRKEEIKELDSRLVGGESRLVSLVGAGGAGKTRLSCSYGFSRQRHFPGGVWFCDLAETHDGLGILRAVGGAIGVPLTGQNPDMQLETWLRGRGNILLILDNFEQVVDCAPSTVSRWLDEVPRLRVLATTRIRLRIPLEEPLFIDPLPVHEAVLLFSDRAREHRSDFQLTDDNRQAVTEIVERLDCMSLAIELAAARMGVLSAADLLKRLSTRFKLLRNQHRDQAERQATLRGAIDWSWNLLKPWEKLALAQCSVFHGGFTTVDAEQVLNLDAFPEAPWAMDVLQSLLDQSLLRRTHPFPGHVRLGLYESVAEYARERLTDPASVTGPDGAALCGPDAARDRQIAHARWYGAITGRIAEQSLSTVQLLSQEWDNLIAGQGYALIEADSMAIRNCTLSANMLLERQGPFLPALSLLQAGVDSVALTPRDRTDLVVELGCVYHALGHKEQGLQLLQEGVDLVQDDAPCLQAAAAFHHLGRVLLHTGRVDKGVAFLKRSVEISEASGEDLQEGITLGHLGIHHKNIGESEEALTCYRKAIHLFEEKGGHGKQAPILGRMAYLHHQRGERELAMDCYGQALDRHREAGNRRNEGIVLANLAAMHLDQGETEPAVDLVEQAVDIHRDMNDLGPLVAALDRRAQVHWRQGRMQEAEADLAEAAGLVGDHWPMGRGINLSRWGELRIRQERLEEALRALEEAVELLEDTNQHEQGRAFCLLAKIAWQENDLETAKSHVGAAEDVAARAGASSVSPLGSRIVEMRERILGVRPF